MPITPETPPLEPVLPIPLPRHDQSSDAYNAYRNLERIATEGQELNKKGMSLCDKILYPPTNQRLCCDHFFAVLCLISTVGTIGGLSVTCCPGVTYPAPIVQQLFGCPALIGWGGSTMCSAVGAAHYRFNATSKYPKNQDQPDPLLGQPIISANTPRGYQPPPTPTIMI